MGVGSPLAAPPLFFGIALLFAMLGMGGSQLYIPILFWLGMDFKTQAIPLGMLLNVVNTSSAAVTYSRRGLINWNIALPFGATMVAFAPLGALVNIGLRTELIILVFALFTTAAAVLMLVGWRPARGIETSRERLALGVGGGSVLGFFAGLIGRGGGSFVVPLLFMVGVAPKAAAATSALIVTCSGTSSFVSHLLTAAQPIWVIWVFCALAVLAGSQLGSRLMSQRLTSRHIRPLFGIVLLGIAALLIVKEVRPG
ncbi:MAG: sulfite exporter TauE/SafE family protein [Chloroflexota bacterium]